MTNLFNNDYSMTIGGRASTSENTFEAFNPATREVIATVPDASKDQLEEAITAARKAQPGWSALPLAERQAKVAQIGKKLAEHAAGFMALLTREQGKPEAGAQWEILGSAFWCDEMAHLSLPEEVIEESAERKVITRYSPLGVVGAITPWNFPVLLAVWKIAPALLTGNTMVLKPSPFTPLCTLKFGEMCREILPPGVLNVVTGGDELGRWMTAHPDINKIAFTGHTETGKGYLDCSPGHQQDSLHRAY